MLSFLRFRGFSFTITRGRNPKKLRVCSLSILKFNAVRVRVIVNEKPQYLEKTTSSVLSLLLIINWTNIVLPSFLQL